LKRYGYGIVIAAAAYQKSPVFIAVSAIGNLTNRLIAPYTDLYHPIMTALRRNGLIQIFGK
jgi:hypothetical protein